MKNIIAWVLALSVLACGTSNETNDGGNDAGPDSPLNGCTTATLTDRTAGGASRVIALSSSAFSPPCMRVAVGQTVTFQGDFNSHPMRPGVNPGGLEAEGVNPIPIVNSGTSVDVTFSGAGTFPFYCAVHHSFGMRGVIVAQ
ncbi:MAG: plastocyanin/azurin family copper-binding protein [Myxococcaceae bacterium]